MDIGNVSQRPTGRRVTRRRFLTQALALMVAAPVAASSLATSVSDVLAVSSPSPVPARIAPATSQAAAEEVVFWHSFGGELGKKLEQYIDGFNTSQDGVKVKAQFAAPSYVELLQKLLPAIAAGTAPDMIQTMTVIQLAKTGALQPLGGLIGAANVDLQDFVPELLEENRYGGELYGLPSSRSTPVLFYNDDLLKEAGLDPMTYLSSWQTIAAEGHRLVKKQGAETSQLAYNAPPAWWFWTQFTWAFGGEMSDSNGNVLFNQGPGVDALGFWHDLIHQHGIARTYPAGTGFAAWEAASTDWFNQRVAVSAQSTAQLTRMLSTAKFNAGVAPLPAMHARAVPHGGSNLMLLASSKRHQAAMEFMSWFTSPAGTTGWHVLSGYLPVRISAQQSHGLQDWFKESPAHKVAVDQLEVARSTPVIAQMAQFETQVASVLLERVLLEPTTPDELQTALNEAAAKTEELWKEFVTL